MDQNRYQVIYKGEILEGYDKPAVLHKVAQILSISAETAGKVLNAKRVVLRKSSDEAKARELCLLLKKAGLRVALGVFQPQAMEGKSQGLTPATPAVRTQTLLSADASVRVADSAAAKLRRKVAGSPKPSAAVATPRMAFEFHGKGSEYFRIWIVNLLLTILTLGIYSAWAKVRRKQYFYGNMRVNGAGFEYLADPFKILKGRLVVVGIFIVAAAASHFFPLIKFLLVAAMVVLSPWLITRSLMFNAFNSAWRNIRFGFKTRYGQAYKAYVLWPLLMILTLGILSPYVYFRQKKFLVENSSYGKTPFSFSASWKDYYRILTVASLLGILAVAVVAAAAAMFAPLAILALPIYIYAYVYFAVETGKLLYNTSRLGRHRLQTTMDVRSFMMLVLANTLATALSLGFFHPWAKVRTMRYKAQHLTLIAAGDLDTFVAERQQQVGAIGDASIDFLNFDLGL